MRIYRPISATIRSQAVEDVGNDFFKHLTATLYKIDSILYSVRS